MRSHKPVSIAVAFGAMLALPAAAWAVTQADVKVGTPVTDAEIAPWDIDISTSDGKGLPPGKGSVAGDLRFVRFRPPKLETTAEGLTLSLPHIRLDRALEYLLGDQLA